MRQGGDIQRRIRTRVYIDGYNLYYGCLKRSADKWLDPRMLVGCILSTLSYEQDGELIGDRCQRLTVKYFTALILETFAKSNDSVACQRHYHAALLAHLEDDLEIIQGYHEARPARAHRWEPRRPPLTCDTIEIWRLEEKQSDVALALHAYSDAIRGQVDQVIVLTNDTDVVPALQMIREHTNVIIGVIAPIRVARGTVNVAIERCAHWTRKNIGDEELARSQLPARVRGSGGMIHKPIGWCPRPDLLAPVFEEAKRVKGSAGAARRWLNQPCTHLGGRIPIEMCADDVSVLALQSYMRRYAKEYGI
ncbi:antitoxin Xre/MbcA/ParS toxin-binding domain-containing protein [Steroidobacter flavus]|uniref:Antitoxin Xre/MbcA/ParS toxin-binding domain-containing protein n=1 Tax=Steroidobacter flavus TaxID=1842136 RepID=A0ABV8SXK2_9GAMM